MPSIQDDLERLRAYVAKFKGRSGYKLLPSPSDPSKKRWQKVTVIKMELPARLQVTGPKLKRRGKRAQTPRQADASIRAAARAAAESLQKEHPEFVEELRRAFAEAPAVGYNQGMSELGHKWAEPKRGLEPQYFPLEDRIEFVDGGTRWKLVGFDMVPLWRPDYGWGYHALYKGDDGTWAEWRFQGQHRSERDDNGEWISKFVIYHENEPFRRIPESTLPPWAHREV